MVQLPIVAGKKERCRKKKITPENCLYYILLYEAVFYSFEAGPEYYRKHVMTYRLF